MRGFFDIRPSPGEQTDDQGKNDGKNGYLEGDEDPVRHEFHDGQVGILFEDGEIGYDADGTEKCYPPRGEEADILLFRDSGPVADVNSYFFLFSHVLESGLLTQPLFLELFVDPLGLDRLDPCID